MATVLAVAFLFSCKEEERTGMMEKNEEKKSAPVAVIKKEIEVRLIGEIRARRTFADIQFIDNEKEKERYIAAQEKENPWIYDLMPGDSMLIRQFRRLGIVKNNEYLKKKFKPLTKEHTFFIDSAKRKFPLNFYIDTLTGDTHFRIFFPRDFIDIDTKAVSLQNLDYTFLDVVPGGNKELIFLDDYYIMNGYNFDLKVYEIKSN